MYLQSMPLYQLVKLAFVLRLLTQASNITHHISSLPPPLSSSPAIFKLKQGIHMNTLLNTQLIQSYFPIKYSQLRVPVECA